MTGFDSEPITVALTERFTIDNGNDNGLGLGKVVRDGTRTKVWGRR